MINGEEVIASNHVNGRKTDRFDFTLDTTDKSLGSHNITAEIDNSPETNDIEIVKGELVVTCSRIDSDTNTKSELTKIRTPYEIPEQQQIYRLADSIGIRTGTTSTSDSTKTEFRVYELDSYWYFCDDSKTYTNSTYINDIGSIYDYENGTETDYGYIIREHAKTQSDQYSISTNVGPSIFQDINIEFLFEDQNNSDASVSGIGWSGNENQNNDLTKHRYYLAIREDSITSSGESEVTVGTNKNSKTKR